MKTIIINGANGYVASNFISSLLKQKCRIIVLVRSNKKLSSKERMMKILADIDDNLIDTTNLEVYDYSLLDNNFSMAEKDLKSIFRNKVDYFHFAASLKYDEKSVDEIFSTNVEGVENSVKVFSRYATKNSRFLYIGTAYSCGRFNGVFEEKFYKNQEISAFRNYYEQSKRFAENIVKENIQRNKLHGYIIRLSQVVGNLETSVTKTDYGIFDFAKRIYNLANRYPNRAVRVHVNPGSTQNLIPVDTVTEHLIKVTDEEEVPEIMNFVSKNSIRNDYIIETLNQLLPIHIIPAKSLKRENMSSIERLISTGMSFTESYTSTNISFDTHNRDQFINSSEIGPDNYSVSMMLKYFIEGLSQKKREKKSVAA